jgi:hypothetical protein
MALLAATDHTAPSTEHVTTAAGPVTATRSAVGDWLLTWGDMPGDLPQRHAGLPWSAELSRGGWTLWCTATGEGWRGAPCLRLDCAPWTAWLVGELYGESTVATIIDVLIGRTSAAALNGHFVLFAHAQESDEWHVWSNRHATLHAYVSQAGSRAAVGSFFPAVAAATGRHELDWEGLTTFFGFGFFGADRTHIAGVRILRPATHCRLAKDGYCRSDAYWEWWHAPDQSRSYDDTLDAFAERFETALREMTAGGRVAMPISGGLDSRTTVAPLPATGDHSHLWAYSYGYSDRSAETTIARQVADARGLAFSAYTIGPYLFPQLAQVTDAVEGFEDVTQCRQAAVAAEIDRHAERLMAAHLGDLYLADMGLASATTVTPDHMTALVLKKVRKGGRAWLLENVCRANLNGADPEQILQDNISSELAKLTMIEEPDYRLKAYKVDQWCARWTTVALRMYQVAAFPRLPFYDTRLEDFFATVPATMLTGRRLQIDYLRRYAPDLARIPWQATGRDLFGNGPSAIGTLAARALRGGRRLLTGRRMIEQNWQIQFAGADGQQGLSDWLLRPGLLLHSMVAPEAVAALLAAFERDPYSNKRSYSVAMLLSISAWLERHYGAMGGTR